jgi:hypothetical protein
MENLVEQLLKETANKKIFTVTFVKKDGSIRKMNAMRGVRKGVKGVGHSFNPSEKNLLTVYDMKIKEFRFVNLNDVLSFTANKKKFVKE